MTLPTETVLFHAGEIVNRLTLLTASELARAAQTPGLSPGYRVILMRLAAIRAEMESPTKDPTT